MIFLTKGERRLHVETPTLTALLVQDVFATADVFWRWLRWVGGGDEGWVQWGGWSMHTTLPERKL